MKSIALEPNTNNFIREKGSFRYTKDNMEYMAGKIRHIISIFSGEWFIAPDMGIPYIPDDDISKTRHRNLIETALRAAIINIKGVKRLTSFNSTLNKASRVLSVDFVVETDEGETIADSVTGGV